MALPCQHKASIEVAQNAEWCANCGALCQEGEDWEFPGFPGFPDEPASHFDRMLGGLGAHNDIEETLYDKYNWIEYIGWDHYDRSLEIYCGPETPADWCFTEEAHVLRAWGFERVWLNFADGTEQHVTLSSVGERRRVDCPRYSEEGARLARENRALKRRLALLDGRTNYCAICEANAKVIERALAEARAAYGIADSEALEKQQEHLEAVIAALEQVAGRQR